MKKILFILIAAIIVACSPKTENREGETIWSLYSTFSRLGDKYAVADSYGVPVTEYIYDELEGLSNGNVLARANGREFLLSKEGKRINNIEFDHFNYCFNGCAIIRDGELYGLLSVTGQLLLPVEYNNINFITPQLALAIKGDYATVIDNTGRAIEHTNLHPDIIMQNLKHYEQIYSSRLMADEKYWNGILDRYEALCNSCIETKILARTSKMQKKESNMALQRIIKEAMAIEDMLKEASGHMTSAQLERLSGITDKYANYEK